MNYDIPPIPHNSFTEAKDILSQLNSGVDWRDLNGQELKVIAFNLPSFHRLICLIDNSGKIYKYEIVMIE